MENLNELAESYERDFQKAVKNKGKVYYVNVKSGRGNEVSMLYLDFMYWISTKAYKIGVNVIK